MERMTNLKDSYKMNTKYMDNYWYIEVDTDDLGKVLLLEPGMLPIPLKFNSEEEALIHIQTLNVIND